MQQRKPMDSEASLIKDIAAWAGPVCVGAIAWIGKHTIGKVERLDQQKADREEIRTIIEELRADRQSADASRQDLHEKVNTVALTVARLEGRLGNGHASGH